MICCRSYCMNIARSVNNPTANMIKYVNICLFNKKYRVDIW